MFHLFFSSSPFQHQGFAATAVVFLVTLVTVKLIALINRKRYKLPPGPYGLPVFGYLPFFGKEPPVTFNLLRRTYGDVISISMGEPYGNISLSSYTAAWKLHRKIVKNVLHMFAGGRNHPTEDIVQTEALGVVKEFLAHGDRGFCPKHTLRVSASSVMYQLIYGKHLNIRNDRDFDDVLKELADFERDAAAGNMIDVMPWLRFIIPWKLAPLIKAFDRAFERRERKIAEHEAGFDENHLRDIVDGLINTRNKLTEQDKAAGLSDKVVVSSPDVLLAAGTGTVSCTLHWFILLMAAYPEVQEKLFKEIDSVVGQGRLPTLGDRPNLPYVQATITEVLRFSSPLPMSLPHATLRDTTLKGFDIPAGTVVLINLYSVSREEELWGDPETFRPERFLDAESRLDVSKTRKVMPFSAGKRRCVGEFLALTNLFLYVTTMMQRVRFYKPAGAPRYTLDAQFSFMREPAPYTATALVFLVTLVTVKLIALINRKRYKLPPGPYGLPIVGYLPFFGKEPPVTFNLLRRTYGDVISISMGSSPAVVVNGREAINEALVTRGDAFSDRPDFTTVRLGDRYNNIAFSSYSAAWKLHRKIVKNVLHVFAGGRNNPTEDVVQTEALVVVKEFLAHGDRDFCPKQTLRVSASSVMYQLIYGKHLNIRNDRDFDDVLKDLSDFERDAAAGNMIDVMPWLRFIIPWKLAPLIRGFQRAFERRERKRAEHEAGFDENHLRDIVDGLINTRNKLTEQDKAAGLSDKVVVSSPDVLLGAGTGTVSCTLLWLILLMAAHPEVQEKLFKEIDSVIGQGRLPTLGDRPNLPYVQATITEVLRFSSPLPMSLPHATLRDTTLKGFDIPAGTVVLINLYSVSREEELWGDPESFRPERFLDAEGRLNISKTRKVMPFSAGTRRCVGEFLALTNLFLYVTTMMQRVRFYKPAGVPRYTLDAQFSFMRDPVPYTATAVIFMVTLVTVKLIAAINRKRYKLPPGPYGLPVFGYLPFFGKEPPVTFNLLRRTYGDVISISMGSFPAVVVNGQEAINEALVTRGDAFSDRPDFTTVRFGERHGNISFSSYTAAWKLHRRIVKNVLHVFAGGRNHPTEDIVQTEALGVVKEFLAHGDQGFCPKQILRVSVSSVMYQLIFGKHLNIRNDRDFDDVLKGLVDFERSAAAGNMIDVMPWLRFIIPWKLAPLINFFERELMRRERKVSEHETGFGENHLRDITDGLIDARNKLTEQDKATGLSDERVVSSTTELLGAGTGTVSCTLYWFILLMVAYPEVQEKLFKEIDSVIGQGRLPTLGDRPNLPYVQATITEVLRFSSPLPMSLPHATLRDTTLRGFDIPAGTVVLINLYSVSREEELWGDPETFRPERFLDAEGRLDVSKTRKVMPFSAGIRRCVGEFLALTNLFLYVTTMMQRVRFYKPAGAPRYTLDAQFTLMRDPAPYTVCTCSREYE
nr:hypothetical protein BaRGS_002792 [Batillaria attramentaria]